MLDVYYLYIIHPTFKKKTNFKVVSVGKKTKKKTFRNISFTKLLRFKTKAKKQPSDTKLCVFTILLLVLCPFQTHITSYKFCIISLVLSVRDDLSCFSKP